MTDYAIDFMRDCARRTNELHRESANDFFYSMLAIFALLGFILVSLAFAGIAVGWQPGSKQNHSQGWVEITP